MKLAVKLHKDVPNPMGLPPEWPAVCRELKDDDPCPDGYQLMSLSEYDAYRAMHRSAYDAWSSSVRDPVETELKGLDKKIKAVGDEIERLETLKEAGVGDNERMVLMKARLPELENRKKRLQEEPLIAMAEKV